FALFDAVVVVAIEVVLFGNKQGIGKILRIPEIFSPRIGIVQQQMGFLSKLIVVGKIRYMVVRMGNRVFKCHCFYPKYDLAASADMRGASRGYAHNLAQCCNDAATKLLRNRDGERASRRGKCSKGASYGRLTTS